MEDLCELTTNLSLKDKKRTNNDILYPLKNHKYFNYQIEVAKWMNIQEKENPNGFKGGIISLSMGLGKTLITLGYSLAHYKNRPTLIVVPKTILIEWKINGVEKFFSNDKNIKVLYFHKDINKNIESLTLEDILKYQIVITTYSLCACTCLQGEYHLPVFERKSRLINLKKGRSLLYYIVWNRLVFDESHKCSNSKNKTFKYIMALSND
jgi:SNF2 family DNA or RNA helicase